MKITLSFCRVLPGLVAVLLLLSACIPDSRYPLPRPADGKGDDRLIGRWIFVGEAEKGHVDISSAGGGRYHVRIQNGPDASLRKTEMDLVPTRIGGQLIMTVIGFGPPEEGGPEGAPHLIVRYAITAQGDLLIYPMNLEALAEDIRAGLVEGEVKPGEIWENVSLTADSEALAAYIVAADPERIFADHPIHMRHP